LERLEKTIAMDPHNPLVLGLLGELYYQKKMPAEAFAAWEKAISLDGIFTPEETAQIREAYHTAGISAFLRKKADFGQKYQSPLYTAMDYAHAGDESQALDWLETAVEQRTPWVVELNVDPNWDGLRSHPRFIALLKKIGLENKTAITKP
jgi:tetratricopeptide (TPR) repeat protein